MHPSRARSVSPNAACTPARTRAHPLARPRTHVHSLSSACGPSAPRPCPAATRCAPDHLGAPRTPCHLHDTPPAAAHLLPQEVLGGRRGIHPEPLALPRGVQPRAALHGAHSSSPCAITTKRKMTIFNFFYRNSFVVQVRAAPFLPRPWCTVHLGRAEAWSAPRARGRRGRAARADGADRGRAVRVSERRCLHGRSRAAACAPHRPGYSARRRVHVNTCRACP